MSWHAANGGMGEGGVALVPQSGLRANIEPIIESSDNRHLVCIRDKDGVKCWFVQR